RTTILATTKESPMTRHSALQFALAASALLLASGVRAASGSGDSAPVFLDTLAPTNGTLMAPPSGLITGFPVDYTGAADTSGLGAVALWYREAGGNWTDSGQSSMLGADTFNFLPAMTGDHHFELVTEDAVGNRTTTPSGSTGMGQ